LTHVSRLPGVAFILKKALISALVALVLFSLMVGIRTEAGPTGQLIYWTRFGDLASIVGAVFGGSLPAEIWRSFMSSATAGMPVLGFPTPSITGRTIYGQGYYVPATTTAIVPANTPPGPPPGGGICEGVGADEGTEAGSGAPGAVKCLNAFHASNPRIAMVIGDMPPPELCSLGVEGPRGPFCMPLRTSSKPIVRSYRLLPPRCKTYRPLVTVTR